MCHQHFLDFARIDVHAPGDDHILLSIDDINVSVAITLGHVPDRHPAVAEDALGFHRLVPVAAEHEGRTTEELADLPGSALGTILADDPDLREGVRQTHATRLPELVRGSQTGDQACLGGTVDLEQAVFAEILDDLLLQDLRQGRGVGDDPRQGRASVPREHRLIERKNLVEMRGHHEYAGDPAVHEPVEHGFGVELVHDLGRAAHEQSRHREGKTPTVAHRRHRQEMIVGRETTEFRRGAVGNQGARPVRKQHAFGPSGRSRGVGNAPGVRFVDVRPRDRLAALFKPSLVLRTDHDDPDVRREACCAHHRLGGSIGEDNSNLRIRTDRRQLYGRVTAVDGGRGDARLGKPADQFDVLDAVPGNDGRVVTGTQAQVADRRMGDMVHPPHEVAKTALDPALPQGDLSGRALAGGSQAGRHGHGPEPVSRSDRSRER